MVSIFGSEQVKHAYMYLKCQISSLHPQVSTDVLVNGPSKFIVQLPSNKRH